MTFDFKKRVFSQNADAIAPSSKSVCVCPPAGYNNLEVAEYLLEHGADVNAQDKGGLIPLHNAASYGVRSTYAPRTPLG